MKLYCYELKQGNTILDVGHVLAKNSRDVHRRLEATIEESQKYELEYDNYTFRKVSIVDGVDIAKVDFNNQQL